MVWSGVEWRGEASSGEVWPERQCGSESDT